MNSFLTLSVRLINIINLYCKRNHANGKFELSLVLTAFIVLQFCLLLLSWSKDKVQFNNLNYTFLCKVTFFYIIISILDTMNIKEHYMFYIIQKLVLLKLINRFKPL